MKTHKGGYPRVPPRPDALTALAQLSAWGGDHNEWAGNERDHRGDLLNMRQSIRELWRPTEARPNHPTRDTPAHEHSGQRQGKDLYSSLRGRVSFEPRNQDTLAHGRFRSR